MTDCCQPRLSPFRMRMTARFSEESELTCPRMSTRAGLMPHSIAIVQSVSDSSFCQAASWPSRPGQPAVRRGCSRIQSAVFMGVVGTRHAARARPIPTVQPPRKRASGQFMGDPPREGG